MTRKKRVRLEIVKHWKLLKLKDYAVDLSSPRQATEI